MNKQKTNKVEIIGIRIDSGFKAECVKYCDDNCYNLSRRIRFLLQKDIEGKLIIK